MTGTLARACKWLSASFISNRHRSPSAKCSDLDRYRQGELTGPNPTDPNVWPFKSNQNISQHIPATLCVSDYGYVFFSFEFPHRLYLTRAAQPKSDNYKSA